MKTSLLSICAVIGFAAAGHAASIDLTDNSFTSVDYVDFVQGPIGPIEEFVETVDGVAFTFSAKPFSGQFRAVGTWGNGTSNVAGPWGLSFGGGGGNTGTFTLSASQDVTLNAVLGMAAPFITGAIYDVTGTGVSSLGNAFATTGSLASGVPVATGFTGGPLSLLAGATYTFDVTNASPSTVSHITGFDFTKVTVTTPAVPLPAGFPLVLTALGALAFLRRKSGAA